jgi:uncharacterized SAM-binding protein YcdF (DUF218 family)
MTDGIYSLAEKIWHYHRLDHRLEKADAILVLCSHDKKVATRAAELFLEDYAPLLIFSGGLGTITKDFWSVPEADQFAEIAFQMGVPEKNVLIENRSANTGENVLFTRRLLAEKGLDPQKFIIVQKPYMERRSFATFKKLWPEKDLIVTSPPVSFAEYLNAYAAAELSTADVVAIIVGDLQRIKLYPEKGFQIYQEIPPDVWAAYEELVALGYDGRLVK